MWSALNQNWVGTTVGIIGVLIGVILYLKSRRRNRLVYQTSGWLLVGKPSETPLGEIKVLFLGIEVPRVTVSRIAIWNAGNRSIQADHLVKKDPLRICVDEGAQILGTRMISTTRDVTSFALAVSPGQINEVLVTFDFADPGDGGIFEIVHTGSSNRPSLRGTVQGIPQGPENWGAIGNWDEARNLMRREFEWATTFIASFIALGLVLGGLQHFFPWFASLESRVFPVAVVGVIVGMITIFLVLLLRIRSRKTPKALRSSQQTNAKLDH